MRRTLGLAFTCLILSTCTDFSGRNAQFQLLKKDHTALDFKNVLKQSLDFNVFNYMYFFNGGGVGVGDFNQDGLEDLYFTSNMGSNKLFLNEGNLKFNDVTIESGVDGIIGWTAGVTVVDINSDGLLDIYVSQMGDFEIFSGQNQLFVCTGVENGIPYFEDRAADLGLDLVGFATQAAFFDYDLDGDLDMFQLNYSLHANGTFGQKESFENTQHPLSGDKLLRNDGSRFTEVTIDAGINSTVIGYGLGIAIGDINRDGWPDIYIGNDFHENDYLYMNNQDGTFDEVLTEQLMHTSRFSMGVDVGDINNDAQNEILSLDMLPEDPFILKSSLGEDAYGIFSFKIGYGYNHQYARNNLQLNNGDGTFTEIGLFADIYATDWSWAPLIFDFDHDGYKDIFVSNGIPKRMNDIDYVNFRSSSEDVKWKTANNYLEEEDLTIIDLMPEIKLPNKFFKNNKDLTFSDIGADVKDSQPTYSNGAAYADLDNDGDLDIVVNNIDDEPFIYKNLEIEEQNDGSVNDYIHLRLIGTENNKQAIGATLVVFKDDEILISENYPTRGYQSSVLSGIHMGLGNSEEVERVLVVWPDRTFTTITPEFNARSTVRWEQGLPEFDFNQLNKEKGYPVDFKEITESSGLNYYHDENPFVEFNREKLIPHMVSREGPALAVGDINGDGLEDVFFGGAKRRKSKIYYQTQGGRFEENTPWVIEKDSIYEDVDAQLGDMDNDGDLDLIVASGGNEYWGESEYLKQRLYFNNGEGEFTRNDVFPEAFMTASCALVGDYDNDGWLDVYFGGRAVPKSYGLTPNSYLFRNMGDGKFEDVSDKYPDLRNPGLVKDGIWSDIDMDNDLDLILAVEWEPVIVMENSGNDFIRKEISDQTGWWNFVLPSDFDRDGDVDLLAGNIGQNSKLKPTKEEPVRLYVEDFDDNGQTEQILTYYVDGREIPFANYMELTEQLVSLKKKYLFSKDLAGASLHEIFGDKLKQAVVREANTFESLYFENIGDMEFKAHLLPVELQFSTLETASLFDSGNESGVILGGNFYECNIEMGRYDSNFGNLLSIGPNGLMKHSPLGDLRIKNQVRKILPVDIDGEVAFIFAKNEDTSQVLKPVIN